MPLNTLERRVSLDAYIEALKRNDLRSVANSLFLGQELLGLENLYDDFEGHGLFGVTSSNLCWDYSILVTTGIRKETNIASHTFSKIESVGKRMSVYAPEDLRLLACATYYGSDILSNAEELRAASLLRDLKNSG
jgi:hypothetical protein